MNPRIPKLEALLARIQSNASQPRAVQAAPVPAPPAAEEHGNEPGTMPSAKNDLELAVTQEREAPPEVEVPLESRARLVAAPAAEDVEEIEADEVVELDDRHIVSEPPAPATPMTMNPPSEQETRDALDVAAAQALASTQQQQTPLHDEEPPPPSSRRPIAEPAETPQEAQIEVQPPHPPQTPPPESGKQVAQEALSFDDDFTGVREAAKPPAPPPPEASIQLQSLRSPPVQSPSVPDEMEADLAGTSPPPGPLPEMRSPRIESAEAMPAVQSGPMTAEVTRPTRPVAAANVAEMIGTVKPASPKTFGELLDAALSL